MSKNNIATELWWVGLVEGIVAILFGIAALFWPGLTLVTLVTLFSVYVLVWGIAEIVHGLASIGKGTWFLPLLFGAFALGVGVYLTRHPQVTFATFILLIGFTFIVRGIVDIVGAFLNKQLATSRVLNIVVGVIAVIAGIIVLKQPVASGVAFVWIIGLFALIYGPITIALSYDLKKLNDA